MQKLTLNQFFRYAYGGLLSFFIIGIIHPSFIKQIVESLGPIITPLVALAVGSGVYVFYRFTIGQWLDNLHLKLHPKEECIFNYLKDKSGIKDRNRIIAFRIIRDSNLLNDTVREALEIRHAEIHIIYLTFVLCLGAVLYLAINYICIHAPITFGAGRLTILFLIIGIFSILVGYFNDLILCKEERFRIEIIYKEKAGEIDQLLSGM